LANSIQRYGERPRIAFYDEQLYRLLMLIQSNLTYRELKEEFKLQPFVDRTGLGAHIVRILRNDLAHGSAIMPMPDDWESGETGLLESEKVHLELIDTSSRLLLLTIQMLLLVFLEDKKCIVNCLLDEDGLHNETEAEIALYMLHFNPHIEDSDQLYHTVRTNFREKIRIEIRSWNEQTHHHHSRAHR